MVDGECTLVYSQKYISRKSIKKSYLHAAATQISQLNENIQTMTPNLYLGDLFDTHRISRLKGLNCYCTQGRGGCWSQSQLSAGEGGVILVTSLHFTAEPKDKSPALTPTANLGFPISTHVHCLCPVGGSGVPGQNLHRLQSWGSNSQPSCFS